MWHNLPSGGPPRGSGSGWPAVRTAGKARPRARGTALKNRARRPGDGRKEPSPAPRGRQERTEPGRPATAGKSRARRPGGQAPDPAWEVPAPGGLCVGTWHTGPHGASGPVGRTAGFGSLVPWPQRVEATGYGHVCAVFRHPAHAARGSHATARDPAASPGDGGPHVTPPRRTRCCGPASSAPAARASRSGGCARVSGRVPCRPPSGCAPGRPRCRSAS